MVFEPESILIIMSHSLKIECVNDVIMIYNMLGWGG
jgi:hypothetical protein